jgi:hypothetical protein
VNSGKSDRGDSGLQQSTASPAQHPVETTFDAATNGPPVKLEFNIYNIDTASSRILPITEPQAQPSAPPMQPMSEQLPSPEAYVDERWPFPKQPPPTGRRELRHAWLLIKAAFGDSGPPRYMSIREITDQANKMREANDTSGGLSESTVQRLLRK